MRNEQDGQPILTTNPDETNAAFDLRDEQERALAVEAVVSLALVGFDIDDYEVRLLELVEESLTVEVRAAMLVSMGYDPTGRALSA